MSRHLAFVLALLTLNCRLKYFSVVVREWSRDLQELAEAWLPERVR